MGIKKKIMVLFNNSKLANKIIRKIINTCSYPLNTYEKKCKKKSEINIWEYKKLAEDMKIYFSDSSPNSTYYGIMYILKKYSRYEKNNYFNIEHGLYYGDYIEDESVNSIYKGIITFSKKRELLLKTKTQKNIYPIGPYIHYASDYYTEHDFNNIKKQIKKTLLCFLPHSTKNEQSLYDEKLILEQLKKYEKTYDTIMICMYYKDIQLERYKKYKEAGYFIVTAGHLYDCNFLARLKSIIKLADYTISFSIGTHIGYCIYLGKVHQIVVLSKNIEKNKHLNFYDTQNLKEYNDNKSFNAEEDLLLKMFCTEQLEITTKQLEIAKEYWGFDMIKTKEELTKIFTDDK